MNSRFNILAQLLAMLVLCMTLASCQDTLPQRPTIAQGKTTKNPTVCPEGQILEEQDDGSKLCVDEPFVRPSNAVLWRNDFCACRNGKAVSFGNCSSFCANKNTNGAERLYATFNVTADVSLSGLGNVHGWCTMLIPGDQKNPSCVLEAKAEDGTKTDILVTVLPGSNSLTADIQDALDYDKTYVLTLVETNSKARSNSIQLVKFSPEIGIPILGPLKNAPISQYSCLVREFSEDTGTGDIFFDSAYRMHFYFLPRVPPNPIPAGMSNLICHDIFNPLYGRFDNELFPRLETKPGVFNLWDTMDPRFYDNNGNGLIDVNEIIVQKTKNFGGTIPSSSSFFSEFRWPGSPQISEDAGNTNAQALGYFMAPWIDQQSYRSYCLTSEHYNTNNALFKALRDIIGVDTEGIYIGEKAPETVITSNGQPTTGFKDYILVRETELKKVWFYLNNGVPTAPTDNNVANVAVYFYYPFNPASPFVKTSTQRIFRVRSASELNSGNTNTSSQISTNGATSSGSITSYPPHDRKIGCVPKF
jgi:hypothetical protein